MSQSIRKFEANVSCNAAEHARASQQLVRDAEERLTSLMSKLRRETEMRLDAMQDGAPSPPSPTPQGTPSPSSEAARDAELRSLERRLLALEKRDAGVDRGESTIRGLVERLERLEGDVAEIGKRTAEARTSSSAVRGLPPGARAERFPCSPTNAPWLPVVAPPP